MATECKFELVAGPFKGATEGPVWDGKAILFSVPAENRILRYDPLSSAVTDFRKYTNRTKGLAFAPDGLLYGCQSGSRRVVRFNPDGSASPLAYSLDGHFHNHPHDLAIDQKGRIWFTDPYDPIPAPGPQLHGPLEHASVLLLDRRVDRSWYIKRMTYDTSSPTGIALSQDEKILYVADNGLGQDKRELRAYPIQDDGTLGSYIVLHTFGSDHRGPHRGISGMCLDSEGHIIACAGSEKSGPGPMIYIFAPSGQIIETHPISERPTKCAFGDEDLSTIYVTTERGHVYRVRHSGRRGLYPPSLGGKEEPLKIDVHAHYVPEKCLDAEAKGTDGHIHGLRIVQEGSRQVAYTNNVRNLAFHPPQIYSIERRLKDMATQWVDMQVLSVPPFLFFYATDPAQSLEQCQKINNGFAETVQTYPERFVALANLPMQDPEMAARELERSVRELGLRGAEICSNINGKNLDDKSFVPFYTKLQQLDVPVFIHPSNVLGADRLRPYHLQNLIGNPTDTAVAAASLIFGGVLKEFPRLKFYLAHGGGSCPYLRGRWEHGWQVRPEARANIDRPPSEYLRLLCFDSLVHSVPALNFLVETVGPGRVMMGTDYPFDMGDRDPVKTVASLPHLSDDQKEMIFGANAAALFKIGDR